MQTNGTKKISTKIISVLIAIAMLFSLFPPVFAVEGEPIAAADIVATDGLVGNEAIWHISH